MKDVAAALDKAKGHFRTLAGRSPAPRDKAQLLEIILATEMLTAPEGFDWNFSYIEEVYVDLLAALSGQALIAVSLEDGAVIPAYIWQRYQSNQKGANASDFWVGFLHSLPRDDPFLDKTPVVPRGDAEKWIAHNVQGQQKAGRPRKECTAAYHELYPDGHKAAGKSWKDVEREVSKCFGESVSADTLKRRLVYK